LILLEKKDSKIFGAGIAQAKIVRSICIKQKNLNEINMLRAGQNCRALDKIVE
jgi:hypothetical protein